MTVMIDRANVNGADNYEEAHRAGARWASFKATEGQGFVDATYHARRKAARDAGILTGAYMFSDNTDPAAEVEHFLVVIGEPGRRVGELRPMLDVERSPHGIPTLSHAEAMAQHLRDEIGYWPILYGSTSVIAPYRAASVRLRACPWMRAEYSVNDGADHALQGGDLGAAIHQYTSVGRLAGCSGFVDLSHIVRGDQLLVPKPKPSKPRIAPAVSWRWARWYLGIGEYEGNRRDPEIRPKNAPHRIPISWWGKVRWYQKHVLRPDKALAKTQAAAAENSGPVEAEREPTPIVDGNGQPIADDRIALGVDAAAPKRSHHRKPTPTKGNP